MRFREADWEKDAGLLRRGEVDYLVNVDPKFDEKTAERVAAERVKTLTRRDEVSGSVLESDEHEPLGYVIYEKRMLSAGEVVVSLLAVWVAPEQRNRGHAQLLLEQTFTIARQMGARQIITFVEPDNLASLNLYTKVGFVQTNIEMARPLE